MLINNTEALKNWLVVVLEPLCDADSSALARYVLALLKKDKPEEELKRVMIEQLDVFLSEETEPFVKRLFEGINTKKFTITPQRASALQMNFATEKTINNDVTTTTVEISSDDVKNEHLINSVSGVIHVLLQKESCETINYIEAAKEKDAAPSAIVKVFSDKNIMPPMKDGKTKDVQNENVAPTITDNTTLSHHQSMIFQQIQPLSDHHHQHGVHTRSALWRSHTKETDGEHHHHRSASPPTVANVNEGDKAYQLRESRRRRASLHSRSYSNERFPRHSRSCDRRVNEREKSKRQFRNNLPPSEGSRGDNRSDRRLIGGEKCRRMINNNLICNTNIDERSSRFGNERRVSTLRGDSGGNSGRLKELHRGFSSQECNNRNKRSPSIGRNHMRSSIDYTPLEPRHYHRETEKRQRCRDFDEKGYCIRGETCLWDHGINPVVFEGLNNSALISMSLREYNPNSPDLWSRTAPPSAPIVVGTAGSSLMAGINPFTRAIRPGGLMIAGHPTHIGFSQVPETPTAGAGLQSAVDYACMASSIFRTAAPMLPFPFNAAAVPAKRQLIPIPEVGASRENGSGGDVSALRKGPNKRRFELEDALAIAEGPSKRKISPHCRLGLRCHSMQNCSLELRRIPYGLNNINHLNNHFAKFGKIVNIQVFYDNDPEAAIVTFSKHAEANVAYRSAGVVLNNRFIKVFWHLARTADLAVILGECNELSGGHNSIIEVRKNNQYHLNNEPATPAADSAKTTNCGQSQLRDSNNALTNSNSDKNISTQDSTSITSTTTTSNACTIATVVVATHVQLPSLRLKNNITPDAVGIGNAIIRRKQEEQVKAVVQLANGLRKRKQELLQSYVKQMKSALELVERCDPSDPQRGKTLDTIKVLEKSIDELRKEISTEQEQIHNQIQNQQPSTITVKQTKELQKKELLDIELELFAQQQEGNDTTAIQNRLEKLQRNLGVLSSSASSTAGSSLGGNLSSKTPHYMGGSRLNSCLRASYSEGTTRFDRRPKTVIVTGFITDESDSVLGHLKHFGKITKHNIDLEKPQLIVSYATRNNAEQAILRGKFYKDKHLQIVWAPVTPTSICTVHNITTTTSAAINQPQLVAGDEIKSAKKKIQSSIWRPSVISPTLHDKIEGNATEGDILPELRLEDEEEEEESEDRTWRR